MVEWFWVLSTDRDLHYLYHDNQNPRLMGMIGLLKACTKKKPRLPWKVNSQPWIVILQTTDFGTSLAQPSLV